MWRSFVFAVTCILVIAACSPSANDQTPAWDETNLQQATASVPSLTPTPALSQTGIVVTAQPRTSLPNATVVHPQTRQDHALSMAELLSTLVAPSATASLSYSPPPPQPFTRGTNSTEFGIQINACDHGVDQTLLILKRLHVRWVKLQVRWGDMEAAPKRIDWTCMDTTIPTLNHSGFKVLASIVTAPAYLRLLPGVNGPPDNFDNYALFVHIFLKRYPGMVQAVEVWNEPNLSAEWDWQIDGAVYRHLLASAYIAIKAVDPAIMVISGALAPTSTGSVWTHVDDQGFIAKFRRYNGDTYTDCVGAHANGPDGIGDIDRVASNYFDWFDRLKPICVTEFGYGLSVQGQAPAGFEWIMHHTAMEQVSTFTQGFTWAKASGFVRLVIVWNLDYWGPPSDPNASFALIRPGWESPAIAAIAQLSNEQQQK